MGDTTDGSAAGSVLAAGLRGVTPRTRRAFTDVGELLPRLSARGRAGEPAGSEWRHTETWRGAAGGGAGDGRGGTSAEAGHGTGGDDSGRRGGGRRVGEMPWLVWCVLTVSQILYIILTSDWGVRWLATGHTHMLF